MPKVKKLVIAYYGVTTQSLLPVTALMWASPCLEEFKLEFYKVYDAACIEVTRDGERSPHQNLKVFEFAGFVRGACQHIELVTYVSKNCVALRKLIIGSAPYRDRSLRWCKTHAEYMDEVEATRDYAKQQLLGKLPQHIQLQLR